MSSTILSAHRLARLAAWLMAMLAWFALGAPGRSTAQRRHHKRYGNVAIQTLRRAVRDVILIEAARHLPRRSPRPQRNYAARGFRRRIPHVSLRAAAGACLRRRLRARGALARQALHLLNVLRIYRALGAEIARRRRKGLTRLGPILMTAPLAEPVPAFAFKSAAFADTS